MWFAFVLIAVLAVVSAEPNTYINSFEATDGCLQYNSKDGYSYEHTYLSTADFRNVQSEKHNATVMRMGVLAKNDGYVRLSPTKYPYDNTPMMEIVLSGWHNTKTVARRYIRTEPGRIKDTLTIKEQSSVGLLSEYKPILFTMAIHPGGLVQLTKDGDAKPFFEFHDSKLSHEYVSFCNWDVPAIYFFDCPLERDQRNCEGIVFS